MTPAARDLFVSYCHEDSGFAHQVTGDLKAAGIGVWIDERIIPGQPWDDAVEEALANCQRMLVILSPASVKSKEVLNEVSFALAKGKAIIPILHKDCEVPFRLHRLQYVDFAKGYGRGLERLLEALAPEQAPEQERRRDTTPDIAPRVLIGPTEWKQFLATGAFQVNTDALRGEILRPIRQTIKPQAFARTASQGGFVTQSSSGFSVGGLLSFKSARTEASGQFDETAQMIRANSTIDGLNLFELVTADRIVSTISVDFAASSTENPIPTLELGGTRVENLRIAGHLVDIALEPVFFEIIPQGGGSSSEKTKTEEDEDQVHTHAYLVARANLAQSFRKISGNIIELRGGDRLVLGELSIQEGMISSTMLRYESQRMGTISVANCRVRIGGS